MPTWDMFRAIGARLGLSREHVEEIERGGVPTAVQDPLDPRVHIHVRPDPDWTQRLTDAWHGVLVNSRRESAGTVAVSNGRLVVGNADAVDAANPSDRGVVIDVVAGEYEVVVTMAHEGTEQDGDFAEHASHAFALLRDNKGAAAIEPMTAADGTELWVEMGGALFAGSGATERLAAEHPETGLWQIVNLPNPSIPATKSGRWKRIATSDGAGALITVSGGYGRGSYPLFRIADPDGRTVGVLVDFFVDNRPYEA